MKNRFAGLLAAAGIVAASAATASAAVDYPDTTELTKGEPVTVAQTGDRHIVRVKAIEPNGQINTAEVYTVVK